MFGFSFSITRDDVSPTLSALAKTARDPMAIFRAMGTTFKSITEGTFNSVGAAYRPTPWRAKRDGSPSILQSRNPTLSKSFWLKVDSNGATVGNPMRYVAAHQFGAVIRPKSGPVLRFNIPGVGWRSVKSVTIPARPFFPVLNGRMTPSAEEKVRRAGERAVLRQTGQAGLT